MLDSTIIVLKQRREAINERLKSLQADAAKLDRALRLLQQMSRAVRGKAPAALPGRKRALSAAERRAIALANRARWTTVLIPKEMEVPPPVERAPEPVHSRPAPHTREEQAILTPSQMVPCTCGGINANCAFCAGTGMREPY